MTCEEAIERLERWVKTAQGYVDSFEQTFSDQKSAWRGDVECFSMAISALRAQQESNDPLTGWISVKDRLPEQTGPAQKVLFVTKAGGLFIGCYYKATAYDQFDGWYSMCVRIDNVTHWMPLPEPPEDDHE